MDDIALTVVSAYEIDGATRRNDVLHAAAGPQLPSLPFGTTLSAM